MSHEAKAQNKRSFRHDRKCGEWLKENVKQGNLNTLKQNVESNNVLPSVTLASLNVTKNESSRLHDRKCGEWLKENVKQGGDKRWHPKSQDVTLDNIGVSKMESSRLQKIAAIPDKIGTLPNLQDA